MLRPRQLDDVAAQLAGEDEEIVRWLLEGRASTPHGVETHIAKSLRRWQSGAARRDLGIRLAATDRLVGNIEANLADDDFGAGEVNISYAIFPTYRGQGLASRAVGLLCAYLGRETDAVRAMLKIDERNLASLRVAAAAGFEPAGRVLERGDGERLVVFRRALHPPRPHATPPAAGRSS